MEVPLFINSHIIRERILSYIVCCGLALHILRRVLILRFGPIALTIIGVLEIIVIVTGIVLIPAGIFVIIFI